MSRTASKHILPAFGRITEFRDAALCFFRWLGERYTDATMAKLEDIRHILDMARSGGFNEVEIKLDGISFYAQLNGVAMTPSSPVSTDPPAEPDQPAAMPEAAIKAPLVGYFEPSPDLGVGSKVEIGQKVGAITALGLSNDIESKVAGELIEVLARSGEPVQFGQPLFRVRPS